MNHYVEVYAAETPSTVVVGIGGGALEVVNPTALVEVVEAASTPTVVELITAGGQGPPGPAGPPGDAASIEMIDLLARFLLASN